MRQVNSQILCHKAFQSACYQMNRHSIQPNRVNEWVDKKKRGHEFDSK